MILALVFALLNQIFSLFDPIIYRLILDDHVMKVGQVPSSELWPGVVMLVLAAMGTAFVSRTAKAFQDYYVNTVTQRAGTGMYANAVEHTFSLPYEVFEDRRSGEILLKMQKAKQDMQAFIASFINNVFLSVVTILFVIGYAFTVHPYVGVAYILLIPVMATFSGWISKSVKKVQKPIVAEVGELSGSTTETIRNVQLVKSLGLEKQEVNRLNSVNEKILQLELKKVTLLRKLNFLQGTSINALRSGLLLLLFWLILQQELTIGQYFSLFAYSFYVFMPLSELGTVAQQYQEAKASTEALNEILATKTTPKKGKTTRTGKLSTIAFDHVTFSYGENGTHSVNGATFTLNAGETIALVGASGSGKSTIAKLLVGLYSPNKGKILMNGEDSSKLDYDDFRRKIGLVAQETQLFAGTIRENLLFVNPRATDEDCIHAMKQANILNLLERAEHGLDTKIGEGGIKISGGERQRLAIARALLRNPELIIFDEATSALDSVTEHAITETIQHIKNERQDLMCVLIAHRLSTIMHADKIIVLEKGTIVESGTHAQLLRKKGLYYAFWRQQSGGSDDV